MEKNEMSTYTEDTCTLATLISQGAHESRVNLLKFILDECLQTEAVVRLKQWLHEQPIDAEIAVSSSYAFVLLSSGEKVDAFPVQDGSLREALIEFCDRPDTGTRSEVNCEEDSDEFEFDCPVNVGKRFDLQAEIDSILNRYPKDSQERQDLLRVKDAVTQLRNLDSHEDDEDDCGYDEEDDEDIDSEPVIEKDDEQNQYTFIVPEDSGSLDMEEVTKILVSTVKHKMPVSKRSFSEGKIGPFVNWTIVGPCTGLSWVHAWRKNLTGVTAPIGTVALRRHPGMTKDRMFVVDFNENSSSWYEVVANGLTLNYSGTC